LWLATVVRRRTPTSGQPGDKAIITRTGEFVGLGWGELRRSPLCVQEAEKALAEWRAEIWWYLPPTSTLEVREGIELYALTC